jgi:hypothetical protein
VPVGVVAPASFRAWSSDCAQFLRHPPREAAVAQADFGGHAGRQTPVHDTGDAAHTAVLRVM